MPQPRAAAGKSDRALELSVLLGGASKSLWWCSSGHGNPSGIEGLPGYGNRRRLKFHQYSTSSLQKLSLLSLPKTPFSLNQLNLKGSGIVCRCHVHDHLLAGLFDSTRIPNPRKLHAEILALRPEARTLGVGHRRRQQIETRHRRISSDGDSGAGQFSPVF
jgi:hypothetical protein